MQEELQHTKSGQYRLSLPMAQAAGHSIFCHGLESGMIWKINYLVPRQVLFFKVTSTKWLAKQTIQHLHSNEYYKSKRTWKPKYGKDIYQGHSSELTRKIN